MPMRFARRRFLHLAAGAALAPAVARTASAQAYPARPVRVVVGAIAGSAPDVIARLVADWLSRRLGQAFFVENRNGASGNLAAEEVAAAPPDGYTLLLTTAANAINVTLYENFKLNIIHDFVPVAGAVAFPMVITVSAKYAVTSLPELIARSKENPGKINIGTPGVGSPQHVAGELLKMTSGANIVLVPYRGGPPAITDALSGRIQGMIGTVLLTIDQIRTGGLHALAVTGAARSELLPDIPTVADFVPGFEASQWIGIAAPKNTPADIVERLNREINSGLTDPGIKAKVVNLGGPVISGTPAEFGQFTADEVAKWGKVIKLANIKPE